MMRPSVEVPICLSVIQAKHILSNVLESIGPVEDDRKGFVATTSSLGPTCVNVNMSTSRVHRL